MHCLGEMGSWSTKLCFQPFVCCQAQYACDVRGFASDYTMLYEIIAKFAIPSGLNNPEDHGEDEVRFRFALFRDWCAPSSTIKVSPLRTESCTTDSFCRFTNAAGFFISFFKSIPGSF